MDERFDYDVFFSYATEDIEFIRSIKTELKKYDVICFVADDDLRARSRGSVGWEIALLEQMTKCRFFAVYSSRSASISDWVIREAKHFYEHVNRQDPGRKMFILLPQRGEGKIVASEVLGEFLRPESREELIEDVLAGLVEALRRERNEATEHLNVREESLMKERDEAREAAREAFNHYRHRRFWGSFSRSKKLHIFTCGRDAATKRGEGRGLGGRTNIDKWDYQTVLVLSEYFAKSDPATQVTIEDPVAKLREADVRGGVRGSHQFAKLFRQLEDKDCVIVGSPDVSDFSEIVLANMHSIAPFQKLNLRPKRRGFAIIKRELIGSSSTYWLAKESEKEGIVWIEEDKTFEAIQEDGKGETYGMLVVCNNPYSHIGRENRIMILAGFTGVATYGIAKLLTSDKCIDEFYKIDKRFGSLDSNFEALIKIHYTYDPKAKDRDSRLVDIEMEGLLVVETMEEIPRHS